MTKPVRKANPRWLGFLLAAIVAALVTLFGAGTASAAPAPAAPTRVAAHTPEAQVGLGPHDGVDAGQQLRESPPTYDSALAACVPTEILVAAAPRLALECSYDGAAAPLYDASVRFGGARTVVQVEAAGPHSTAVSLGKQPGAVAHRVVAVPGFAVAAKSVPTVTFSRSRGPGIAQNFDNAVANGAPTRLTRVGDATRNANRRDALRGQPRAPAGQSLDEYPFACSAQGGCGSFVRSVPGGEQNYQGGVLSQFFQRSGVQPGDPFDVMFGP